MTWDAINQNARMLSYRMLWYFTILSIDRFKWYVVNESVYLIIYSNRSEDETCRISKVSPDGLELLGARASAASIMIKLGHYNDVIMGEILPLCGDFTGDRWIPRTNGNLRGKCFHLMTSSWTMWTLYGHIKMVLSTLTAVIFLFVFRIKSVQNGQSWNGISNFYN